MLALLSPIAVDKFDTSLDVAVTLPSINDTSLVKVLSALAFAFNSLLTSTIVGSIIAVIPAVAKLASATIE